MLPSTGLSRIFFSFGAFSLGVARMHTWSTSPIPLCVPRTFTERCNMKKHGYRTNWSKKKKKVRTTDFATSTFPIPSVAKCGENYSSPKGSLSTLNEIIRSICNLWNIGK